MKYTGKCAGVNTSSMFYSKRARERKKKEIKKFYREYNQKCGECTTYFASSEEIEKMFKQN